MLNRSVKRIYPTDDNIKKRISLLKSGNNSYAEIPYPDSGALLAALTKQAFVTIEQEQVNYSHRTIAEYLAACWLVNSISEGLPVSRVRGWLGVDNYPAQESRGLYAWLVQLLPEYAKYNNCNKALKSIKSGFACTPFPPLCPPPR